MIGVGIIAFDRPHYLHRLLASLKQQDYAGSVEYHLFLDGAVNEYSGRTVGDATRIEHAHRIFSQSGLEGIVHRQVRNQGIALHQYAATEQMTQEYDRVLMVEDDVILSPHWLRLADMLLNQYADDLTVFGFSPGFKRLGCDIDALRFWWGHWWCEAFTSAAWLRMRLFYRDYLDIVRGVDYATRDHDAIKALFARWGWVHPATSQDAAKDGAINRAGMRRVVCEVNRAISIGRDGVHFTPELFKAGGFDGQLPYTFANDVTRTEFYEPVNA